MKIGVLGLGGNGRGKLRVLRTSPLVSELVGMDVNPDQAEKVAGEFNIPTFTDADHILDDPDVKLVFVSTSNDAHKDLSIAAMNAGKAVLCEKPMATSLSGARAMVEAAETAGTYFEIGFELRFSKLFMKVKEWIDADLLGDVVNTNCYYTSSEFMGRHSWRITKAACGDMFGEKLCHYVDLPRWWIGDKVTEVYTVCAPNVVPYYEIRDNYHTTYRFANGAVSHLCFMMAPGATFRGDPLQDVIDQQRGDGHDLRYFVQGTKGAAEADIFNRRIKRWAFGDSPEGFTSDWVEDLTWPTAEDHDYYHNTTDQTLDIVRRVAGGLPPSTPARDAYETTRLCYAAEKSADTGRIVHIDEMV